MKTKLIVAVSTILICRAAYGQTIGVELIGAWTDPVARGNIRRLDATLRFSPRLRGGAGVTLFLGRRAALSISDSRGSVPVILEANGDIPGRSRLSLEYRDAILKAFYGQSDVRGYAGVGLALPAVRNLRPLTSGSITLFRASTPDHASLIIDGGAEYRILPHVHGFVDLKYEPLASTAEVRRAEFPQDDLEASFHLLIFASGLSIRF
jgi:hypothetical protein